jgi:geranylgeranyl pyrophosphate synthase
MLVLVTTTWNTSAADPKRAIARADALISRATSLLQNIQAERTKRKAREFACRSWEFMAEGYLFSIYKQSR